MMMASRVPATTRSSLLSSILLTGGPTTSWSSSIPIRTAPIGPWNGIGEVDSAREGPLIARGAGFPPPSTRGTGWPPSAALPEVLGHHRAVGTGGDARGE